MDDSVLSLVGATGGAGTTRLALELGGRLAANGRTVLVVDAAYGTQGLAMAVEGPIDPDVTRVVTEDRPLAAATVAVDLDGEVPGRLAVAPARAPFERLSRAKTSKCARQLAEYLAIAAEEYDHVIVDTPPIAANQALAAVTAADRVGLVGPDSQRGADAFVRMRDRLSDVDAPLDAVVATRAGESPTVEAADCLVPPAEESALSAAPTGHLGATEFAAAIADIAGTLTDASVDIEPEDDGLVPSYLGG